MLFLGMEMVHVLPRWPDMTMEVDIEGEVLVMAVEAMAAEATEVAEAMVVVEATVAAAMVVAPTPTGEAMVEVAAEAIEAAREETTEGLVEEATEDLGDSSEEVAEGDMGVATLVKEEEVVAIKAWLCWCLCIDYKNDACYLSSRVYMLPISKPIFHPFCGSLWFKETKHIDTLVILFILCKIMIYYKSTTICIFSLRSKDLLLKLT